MPIFDDAKLDATRQIIQKHHLAAVARVAGLDVLSPEEQQLIANMNVQQETDIFEEAYLFGQMSTVLELEQALALSYTEFKTSLEAEPQTYALDEFQQRAVLAAKRQGAQYIRGLGQRVDLDVGQTMLDAEEAQRQREMISGEVADAIETSTQAATLASSLREKSGDYLKDWDKIAVTEMHNARQHGIADTLRSRHGSGARVFKQILPDACVYCRRLHIGPDGTPRIFKLTDLDLTNVGRRKPEWQAVVGAVHPHCFEAGVPVTTPRGWIPIERIYPGDSVLTHEGRWRRVTHTWSSYWDQDVLDIELASGELLHGVTPNHPFRVGDSWRVAGSLQIGEDLAHMHASWIDASRVTTAEDRPTLPTERGRFARIVILLPRCGVPIAAIDFDGELFLQERQIDVVDFDGEIDDGFFTLTSQGFVQKSFVGRIERTLTGLRAGDSFFARTGPTPDGFVCGSRVDLPLFDRHFLVPDELSLPAVAGRSTSTDHASLDGPAVDAETPSYLLYREQLVEVHPEDRVDVELPTITAVDVSHYAIVNVTRRQVNGPVYNLTVDEDHSYVVGNVIAHNCQCETIRMPDGWGFDEHGDLTPGGIYGVQFGGEEDVQKAIAEEEALQKAFRLQGRVTYQGMDIAIENRVGSVRKWRGGETKMQFAYGYVEDSEGPDGDEYDVYVGPDPQAPFVFVVHQMKTPEFKEYDEDKAMLGFSNPHQAKEAYLEHYDDPRFFGSMSMIAIDEFKEKVYETKRSDEDGMVKSRPRLVLRKGVTGASRIGPTDNPTPPQYPAGSTLAMHQATFTSQAGNRNVKDGTTGPNLLFRNPQPPHGGTEPGPRRKQLADWTAETSEQAQKFRAQRKVPAQKLREEATKNYTSPHVTGYTDWEGRAKADEAARDLAPDRKEAVERKLEERERSKKVSPYRTSEAEASPYIRPELLDDGRTRHAPPEVGKEPKGKEPKAKVVKKGLGEVRLFTPGDLFIVQIGQSATEFSSLSAACDHVWCLQKGYESVDDFRTKTGKRKVPSGAGWKFWGITAAAS